MSPASILHVVVWSLALTYLLGPGWLLVFWLFPHEPPLWKMAVGGGMGIVLLGLIALGLSYLPAGITYAGLMIAIGVLNGALALLLLPALTSVSKALCRRVFASETRRKRDWLSRLPAALAVLVFVVFLAVVPSLSQGVRESYTEFYIVDGFLESPPWRRQVSAAEAVSLTFAVVSREAREEPFQVRVVTEGETVQTIHLGALQPGTGVQGSISLPPQASRQQLYVLMLYKGDLETPYRTLHFWLWTSPAQPDRGTT